ncbi:hypothetical protein ACFX2I_003002 [Malus domestica]
MLLKLQTEATTLSAQVTLLQATEHRRVQSELSSVIQKITSLNDMCKRSQEYIASLQQYSSKHHDDFLTVDEKFKFVEEEKVNTVENLSMARLQQCNSKLHNDFLKVEEEFKCMEKEKVNMVVNLSMLLSVSRVSFSFEIVSNA